MSLELWDSVEFQIKLFLRAKFGCAVFNENLWVVGGYDHNTLDQTENFGIYSEQWQEGPKLIHQRHDSAIVSTKKGLFVIGIELRYFLDPLCLRSKLNP